MRILAENTSCIVIDYQEKILPAMSGREELVANSAALLKGLNLLEIPMVLTTQYAKGLEIIFRRFVKQLEVMWHMTRPHFLHMKQKRYMKQWIKSVKMS